MNRVGILELVCDCKGGHSIHSHGGGCANCLENPHNGSVVPFANSFQPSVLAMDAIDVLSDSNGRSDDERRPENRAVPSPATDSMPLPPDDSEAKGPMAALGKLVIISTS
jgi:hypothetical protein